MLSTRIYSLGIPVMEQHVDFLRNTRTWTRLSCHIKRECARKRVVVVCVAWWLYCRNGRVTGSKGKKARSTQQTKQNKWNQPRNAINANKQHKNDRQHATGRTQRNNTTQNIMHVKEAKGPNTVEDHVLVRVSHLRWDNSISKIRSPAGMWQGYILDAKSCEVILPSHLLIKEH